MAAKKHRRNMVETPRRWPRRAAADRVLNRIGGSSVTESNVTCREDRGLKEPSHWSLH